MRVQSANKPVKSRTELTIESKSNRVSRGIPNFVGQKNDEPSTKVKLGVMATTLIGIASVMALVFKCKKIPFNTPSKFLKGLTTITYDESKNEVAKLVGALGVGSIGAGLIGGAIFDKKENMKAKFRESIIQGVGNVGTPLVFVLAGVKMFEKHLEPKIIEKLKLRSNCAKGVPGVIASAACLLTGISAGNKIGNFINEKIFKIHHKRKLKASDMSPHIDDACLAISLIAPKSAIGSVVTRFIPAALIVAGFQTGIAQEKK